MAWVSGTLSPPLLVFTLFLIYLIVTIFRERQQRNSTRKELDYLKKVVGDADTLISQVVSDQQLFDDAYRDTFKHDSKITIRDLFEIKKRVTRSLYSALRRMPCDLKAERQLKSYIEEVNHAMCDKISDVRLRLNQGYWPELLGDYFFKKSQRGKMDFTGLKKATVVTKMEDGMERLSRHLNGTMIV